MQISRHTVVTIEYTLTDTQGNIIGSSKNTGPLSYIHGMGNMIPGIELALDQKSPGDSFNVSIPPELAYPSDKESLDEIPRNHLDADDLQIGMQFKTRTEAGSIYATVKKIDGDKVTVATRHPLAGATLNFDVTIIEVRDATNEEISHGHVHTSNTHHH